MQPGLKFAGVSIAAFYLGTSLALGAGGAWSFGTEDRGHPVLSYAEKDKTIFQVGCGHAFGLHAVYPGSRKKEGEKARITLDNGKRRMTIAGEISESFEDDPPNTTYFVQWDLGYKRQDPGLYGKKWKLREHRLLDFLDSGRPLRVSASGGTSYVLPPVRARGWKSRFEQIC